MPYVITCEDKTGRVYYVSHMWGYDGNDYGYRNRTELIGDALVMYSMGRAMKVLKDERERLKNYDFYKICNIAAYPLNMIDEEMAVNLCEVLECDKCPASCNPDIRSRDDKENLHVPCLVNLLDEEAALDYIDEYREMQKHEET